MSDRPGRPFQSMGSANFALAIVAVRHCFHESGLSVQETPILPSVITRIMRPELRDLLPIAMLSCFKSAPIDSEEAYRISVSSASGSELRNISSINLTPPDYCFI